MVSLAQASTQSGWPNFLGTHMACSRAASYSRVFVLFNLETAVDRFLALDTPYELQLLCAPARSPQW